MTGRNLLSPVLTGAAADVTAFDAKVAASQEKASTSAEASAKAQTTAAERVQAANARTATSSSESAAKVTAANTRVAESSSASSKKVVESNLKAGESARLFADASESSAARAGAAWGSLATKALPIALAAGIVVTAKMAGDYQQLVTKLETTAGETKANIGMVSQGMLDMAGQVGISATELATGMYTVESAGYHGAAGLNVLKASAQGARQENADLGKVADAVSTILHDYHLPASQAATVTSELVTAVSHGKTTFDELTGSLHSVTPLASVLGVTIADVTGTLSAMTASGMSADQATQNMADTLRHLASPTSTMTAELAQLGITSSDLSNDLSTKGLAGTLQLVETAIVNHLDPATQKVLLPALNQSKTAAQDLKIMLGSMPAPLAKLSQGLLDGSTSVTGYTKASKALGGQQAAMALQFLSLYKSSDGFNNVLKAGGPAQQAFASAMAKSFGTASALSVALMTTGENAAVTNAAVKDIAKSSGDAAGNIKGWGEVQGNFNQKLAQAGAEAKTLAIEAGQHLLPVLTNVVGWVGSTGLPAIGKFGSGIGDLVHWFSQLPGPVKAVAEVLGGMALANAVGVFSRIGTAVSSAKFAMGVFAASAKTSMGQVSASFAEAKAASAFVQTLDGGTASRFTGALSGMGAAASTAAKGGFSALKSAGSGLISMFGGPWVVGLAAAVGVALEFNNALGASQRRIDSYATSLFNLKKQQDLGGQGSVEATKKLDDYQKKVDAAQKSLDAATAATHSYGDAGYAASVGTSYVSQHVDELRAALVKAKNEMSSYRAGLSPVETAQITLTRAQNDLNAALAHNPIDSTAVAHAAGALHDAQTGLATATQQANDAAKTQIERQQEQASALLGALDAQRQAQLAQLDLADAVDQYNTDAKSGQVSSRDLKREQLNLVGSAEQAAKAAADGAAAQAQQNGATDTGYTSQVAYRDALQKAADKMNGPARQAILDLIKKLGGSSDAADHAATRMENLGATVTSLPTAHTIVINAPTAKQEADLAHLGYVTTHLPNGQVVVTADTHPAESEIRGMLAWARTQSIVLRSSMSDLNGSASGTGRMGTYAAGGWTGPGGKYTPAGVVHANEFVVPSERVDALGGPGQVGALVGMPGYAAGGVVVPVSVDPRSIAAMHSQLSAASKAYSASMSVSGGTERWRSAVDQVLGLLRQPVSYDNGVLAMIQAESGGNPRAINLTDSNARAGHPSQGLMQTIPGTFYAYAGPYAGRGITDPFANIYAGVNYALHRYGPGILASGGRHSAPGHYIGYKTGTDFVPNDGLAYLHRGERVVPAERNFTPTGAPGYSAATGGRTAITVAAPPAPQVTVHFHVDGAEFRGMTRTEIDHALGQLADTIHYAGG